MRMQWGGYEKMNWNQRMVYDTVGPQFFSTHQEPEAEGASSSFPAGVRRMTMMSGLSERFFDVVQSVDQPLYSGNGCMLYWKDDIDMEYCKFCGDPRYKPTRDRNPRRKKSPYAVLSHVTEEDSMCHPSDAEAWRHFDRTHPNFALEPRNIRLGLCIDGFAPHGQYGRTYSCWPVIITPYNLPPGMCVRTYDHATNQAFIMRAALMWTVNDLPAYGMASGWSTAELQVDERRLNVMPKAVYTLTEDQKRKQQPLARRQPPTRPSPSPTACAHPSRSQSQSRRLPLPKSDPPLAVAEAAACRCRPSPSTAVPPLPI
ncbi:UNVERIFIED_CONTAM: hypothetical protein Scaly_2238900 [Sesamum calycinum]|uniref:Uncharacterized protein n=1 Tax=Sesamum calycinum TaxID=2727403 RepID=A0AAW2MAF4_9LAMI